MVGVVVASALNQLGRFTEAVAELDRALPAESTTWQAGFEHARAEIGLHNAPGALHWSQIAVDAAPVGCTDARLLLANAFQLSGRADRAIQELETYLKLDRQGASQAHVAATLNRLRVATSPEYATQVAFRQPADTPGSSTNSSQTFLGPQP